MKKTIRIFACLVVVIPLSVAILSFATPVLDPLPAPTYTNVEITDIPQVPNPPYPYYSMRVDISGPSYTNPLNTVYSVYLTVSSPSSTSTFTADKKFYYSESSDHTNATVYVKQYSYSSWTSLGACNTDEGTVTVDVDENNFLEEMSFSFDDLDEPPPR